LVTGALAIRCSLKGPATVALLAPACLLVIPLFDSAMAILRRKLTGRSIFTTDRAHIHHRLKNVGFSDKGLLAITVCMSLFVSMGAIGGMLLKLEWVSIASALTVVAILIASKVFGFAEMSLLARRLSHFVSSIFEPVGGTSEIVRQKAIRLQGSRSWELVWATLTEFADRQQLSRVHLDLNVPWLHEGFHATWQRSKMPDRLERWSTSLPLYADGRPAGRLEIVGPVVDGKAFHALSQLADILEDLGPQIEAMVQSPVTTGIGIVDEEGNLREIEETVSSRAS
jgi:UDP-GlcNAc:undecaprenyl-phosphate GlcNAc-1-phosphate transferase